MDGHEARGGSSTCVRFARPWSSPWPSTRRCGTSRRPASPGTRTRWPARSGRRGVRVLRVGARRSGELPRRLSSRTLHTLAELPRVLPRSGASLFHAVGNVDLPLLRIPGVPFVLTVHDLIPLTSPDSVSRAFHWQFRLWLARSLRVADHVVCVSSVDPVASSSPVTPSWTRRGSRWCTTGWTTPGRARSMRRRRHWLRSLGLPERWVLFAGALDARKNVELVLDALERLGPAAPTLVLAGQRWYGAGRDRAAHRWASARAGLDIRPLGYLAEPLLWALMAAAPVFVFPSRDEGFGLPPLEAMALGTPVVVSTAAALPEVCGDAAVQVAPDDAGGLATALQGLLDDPAERSAPCARPAAPTPRAFRWDTTADAPGGGVPQPRAAADGVLGSCGEPVLASGSRAPDSRFALALLLGLHRRRPARRRTSSPISGRTRPTLRRVAGAHHRASRPGGERGPVHPLQHRRRHGRFVPPRHAGRHSR